MDQVRSIVSCQNEKQLNFRQQLRMIFRRVFPKFRESNKITQHSNWIFDTSNVFHESSEIIYKFRSRISLKLNEMTSEITSRWYYISANAIYSTEIEFHSSSSFEGRLSSRESKNQLTRVSLRKFHQNPTEIGRDAASTICSNLILKIRSGARWTDLTAS